MIFLLLQGVYFQLFVCKVIRLYNLPLQLTEQNKRTECLRKSITYRPCSRRGKSSLSQVFWLVSSAAPSQFKTSGKECAKLPNQGWNSQQRVLSPILTAFPYYFRQQNNFRKTLRRKVKKNICFIALKYNGTYCQICGRKTFYSNEDLPVSAGVCLTCYVTSRSKATWIVFWGLPMPWFFGEWLRWFKSRYYGICPVRSGSDSMQWTGIVVCFRSCCDVMFWNYVVWDKGSKYSHSRLERLRALFDRRVKVHISIPISRIHSMCKTVFTIYWKSCLYRISIWNRSFLW